jgi:thioredoxin reductase
MPAATDVAIIGAGPYGLSTAAYLRAANVECRVVGRPMQTWLTQMPEGMCLKSEGFASNLYDPEARLTLGRYCAERGLPYADMGLPVPLDTFCAYGLAFQKRFVPDVAERTLVRLERSSAGFTLGLDDGESFTARRVVLAVGITNFRHMPDEVAQLPADYVTHASQHHDVAKFKGREVIVLGAGASATELAVLLQEAGASVQLVSRRSDIEVHNPMKLPRPLVDRIRAPMTGIGPHWKSVFYTNAPLLFYRLSEERRLRTVRTWLGPAGSCYIHERFKRVPQVVGFKWWRADVRDSRIHLHLTGKDGTERQVSAEHLICATGYKPDLRRLAFLSDSLYGRINAVEHTPVLSTQFESSVPGLYFIGVTAANCFGPMLRFAFGAGFAAPRIARHLARGASRRPAVQETPYLEPQTASESGD